MKNIIVCLGFNPNDDGAILPILEARLKDAIRLCRENPGSTLLLMGGVTFRNVNLEPPSQALLMKNYIKDNAPDLTKNTEIIMEGGGSSTVAELAFLKEYLEKERGENKITIIASEFFVERVRLYAGYMFLNLQDINFIGSNVPEDEREGFGKIEDDKLDKARKWLDGHKKGDYQTVLKEQQEFERRIINGEVKHPVSQSFKPR